MKTNYVFGIQQLVGLFLINLNLLGFAQSDSLGRPTTGTNQEIQWGDPTNGVVAGLSVERMANKDDRITIRVFLSMISGTNGIGAKDQDISFSRYFGAVEQSGKQPYQDGMFFQPTNEFCGLVELKDATGVQRRLLKPIAASEGFSPAFRLGQLGYEHPFKARTLVPLLGKRPQLGSFDLQSLYGVLSPGDYRLTVWPKVYMRASAQDNLCERIDLAPITIMIPMPGLVRTNSAKGQL